MSELIAMIKPKPWAVKLLKPVWMVQVYFGFSVWVPDCAFEMDINKVDL